MSINDREELITLFDGGTELQPEPGVWNSNTPGRYRDFRSAIPCFTGYGTLIEKIIPESGTDSRKGTVFAHEVMLITDDETNPVIPINCETTHILNSEEKCRTVIEAAIKQREKADQELT